MVAGNRYELKLRTEARDGTVLLGLSGLRMKDADERTTPSTSSLGS